MMVREKELYESTKKMSIAEMRKRVDELRSRANWKDMPPEEWIELGLIAAMLGQKTEEEYDRGFRDGLADYGNYL